MEITTKSTSESSEPIAYGFLFFLSVVIWAMGALTFRLWGHIFFNPDSNLSMGASFLFLLVFWIPLVYGIFQWTKVLPEQRSEVAIYMAIPSMLLDVFTTYFFEQFYPNMSVTASGQYAAWLLCAYALFLLVAVITGKSGNSQKV